MIVIKTDVLYIDLDNVVFDTISTIKQMYDEDFRLYDEYKWIPTHMIRHYDFSELHYMTPEKLMSYFSSGRFFDNLQYQEAAEATIAYLSRYYLIVFVSIGTPENLKGKREWVDAFNKLWRVNAEFIGVTKNDKTHLDLSGGVLIDDEMKNLVNSSADINICFGTYEWNYDYGGLRMNSWAEIKKYLEEEVKQRVVRNN